eukprot:Nk52_evm23s1360 gene=Nk52_evmTU23s1360
MSADLQWSVMRKTSSFIVPRAGKLFSSDANNVTGKHSFSADGLVNKKTVGVTAGENNKGVVLTLKNKCGLKKPSKAYRQVKLSRGARRTMNAIKSATAGSYYRGDLTKAAMAKASAILKSQKPLAPAQKKKRSRKN